MDVYSKRSAIEEAFKVIDGVIVSPGRYEGAPVYTPYYHGRSAQRGKHLHTIRDGDVAEFPELSGYNTVLVTEGDDGRVKAEAFASSEYW